jgi:hypothetical protein
VVSKGSRALEEIPASPDAFVWLALYLAEGGPAGDGVVWRTLRPSSRPLTYHAMRAALMRANTALGANYSLHDLRHTAALRMERRGVASDATFRRSCEDGAVRDGSPSTAGRRSRRQSEAAGQDGRDRTVLRRLPACCIHEVRVPGAVSGGFQYRTPPEAVFPDDVIRRHQEFIARRRARRDSAEYRDVEPGEWADFAKHFQLRRVELGDCFRPYGTPCIHEHACIKCPLLRIDPAQMPRLEQIEVSTVSRLAEARERQWLGEVSALEDNLRHIRSRKAQTTARP